MNVFGLDCGSSSVKFRLLAVDPGAPAAAARLLAGGALKTVYEGYGHPDEDPRRREARGDLVKREGHR